jgi:FAD:protein FMN transferase
VYAVVLALGFGSRARAEEFTFFHENVMGTSLELRVRADSGAAARRAEGAVLTEIDRLSTIFSGYDPTSEFRRWQSGPHEAVRVSNELLEVLRASDRWREASAGAFDPRAQVLSQLWSAAERLGRLPSASELAEAKAILARPAWRLEEQTATRLSDVPVTLNAIAKGYIVERAADSALSTEGVRGLLLNVGGDLRVCGDFTQTIGIAAPDSDTESSAPIALVALKDRALATSGRSQRGFRIDGRWYSHILDPRTLQPAAEVASASVIAPRSMDADALATVFNVLTPAESLKLASTQEGVDCLIINRDGRQFRTPGWGAFERPMQLALADKAATAKEPAWGDEFELLVSFEVNRPGADGGRYRRPYVAIWVEDKDGRAVRNLVLWVSSGGAGPFQWIPDLKRWHAADKVRRKTDKREMVFVIGRPTRPPGKYTTLWDGKDDFGKPLPPGKYTLYIDAAREHGTYQNMKQAITVADKPFSAELKGGEEIKGATVEFRRKGTDQ